jgi:hypothetical protein
MVMKQLQEWIPLLRLWFHFRNSLLSKHSLQTQPLVEQSLSSDMIRILLLTKLWLAVLNPNEQAKYAEAVCRTLYCCNILYFIAETMATVCKQLSSTLGRQTISFMNGLAEVLEKVSG